MRRRGAPPNTSMLALASAATGGFGEIDLATCIHLVAARQLASWTAARALSTPPPKEQPSSSAQQEKKKRDQLYR